MRRILMVGTVALIMAALMVATAVPVFANKGGFPSENSSNHACHGQTIRGKITDDGKTPPVLAEEAEQAGFDVENAGDLSKLIKTEPIYFDCASPV